MRKPVLVAAICLLVASLSGCAVFNSKAGADTDVEPEWIENLKSLKGTGASTGASREAREIEKSLGAL
ncbi:MAG: hypothetical protein H8E66_08725 [Planctomycetes bacterium]|nr:hypothetical protein [Planctomycetota bacterium]